MRAARQTVIFGLLGLSACAAFEPRRSLSLAETAFREGRYSTAEARGQAALAAAQRSGDQDALGEAAGFLAAVQVLEGRSAKAEALYREALGAYERAPDPPAAAATAYALAGVLSLEGKNAEAEALYKRAVAASEAPGVSAEELLERLDGLAQFYELHRRLDEAAVYAKRADALAQRLGRKRAR